MPSAEDHLTRWRDAGLLDAGQAERILAFERERERAADAQSAAGDRPGVLEAVLYLGVAVLAVGAVTLVAQNWDDLRPGARVATLLVPGGLLLLAGQVMRTAGGRPVARASTIAWLVSVALIAGGVGVLGGQAGWEERPTALLAGVAATALALALWAVQPSHPQVIAIAGSLVLLSVASATWAEDYEARAMGLLLVLFGATGCFLAERGSFGPRVTARILGAAGVMGGLLIAAYLDGGGDGTASLEVLVFLAGGALIWIALQRAAFSYLVVAVGGIFLGLIFFIFRHFEDDLGAPVALLLSGALIIAAALLLAVARGRLQRESA